MEANFLVSCAHHCFWNKFMRLEVETGLTIIAFPKLAEAAGNARGVPNGGVRSRSAISGKMCISPRCMIPHLDKRLVPGVACRPIPTHTDNI